MLVCGGKLKIHFQKDYNYYQLPIKDSKKTENISQYFKSTNEFIDLNRQTGNIFIHCQRGVSRSGTITIAYLMWKNNWTYDNAFKHIKIKRNTVLPRENFVDELKLYEKSFNTGLNEVKEIKEIKENNEIKENKEIKVIKDTKDTKVIKVIKDNKDIQNIKKKGE